MSAAFQVAVAKGYKPKGVSTANLTDAKINRSKMTFQQRMEADAYNKKINGQLSDMRASSDLLKTRVDKIARDKTRPDRDPRVIAAKKSATGLEPPKIVVHDNKKISETHNKKQQWGPMEMMY